MICCKKEHESLIRIIPSYFLGSKRGEWSPWSDWSSCAGTECQTGTRTRTRTCIGPYSCEGGNTDTDNTCTVPISGVPCGKYTVSISTCHFTILPIFRKLRYCKIYLSLLACKHFLLLNSYISASSQN